MSDASKMAWREFHISRACRDTFHFDLSLFDSRGKVIFPSFRHVRDFVERIRSHPQSSHFPEGSLRAGEVNAMGLIDEILHFVVFLYQEQKAKGAMAKALEWLEEKKGAAAVSGALLRFSRQFPPLEIYRHPPNEAPYYRRLRRDKELRCAVLEEMLLLWLANANPAFSPYGLLFSDEPLRLRASYLPLIEEARRFFEGQPHFGPDDQNLVDLLQSPSIAEPHSLSGQLEFIRRRWGMLLEPYWSRLLVSLDLIREEEKTAAEGPGPQPSIDFSSYAGEAERFSQDADWMPSLVLIAKSVHVWLDQLSQKYGQPITTLDRIPDAELDQLAGWGFTGLWLIGIWERSQASRTIKRLCGNPEAMASAYSLREYRIAEELGGEGAFENLKARAFQRGIRMAADMVPNHMGIDSPWVVEHPDWFIQMDHAPFPAYRFSGPDLSSDGRVAIMLEDHYYSRQDAAVVFKWIDRGTGQARYIYHGNDGTRMPWNDTAQLNYLLPHVREAVMQSILAVAKRFPIIRFDAAMTLTKRHFQRLWFPAPGSGGDIPSRAGQGMDKADFDRLLPEEFWRQVVDRAAAENANCLLLAEAFWLLEGYFVRTLGMHRVYNSAFMNFLKNEENDRFREMVKNILAFQPEILGRFVNFLNNPDEETAATQFGKGDKYFGVCALMATLPGLPMFGHGQVEGFQEKYGMEYPRAYWQERTDAELVGRHEREIFPLLRRRRLFAGVQCFQLFDFVQPDGRVNENVIAYANGQGEQRALVLTNNTYERTEGRIHGSVPRLPAPGGQAAESTDLLAALGARGGEGCFLAMRELRSGQEFLFSTAEVRERGIFFPLNGYETRVYLDIWELRENEWGHLKLLASRLNGLGVPSLEQALAQVAREPLLGSMRSLLNPAFFGAMREAILAGLETWKDKAEEEWSRRLEPLLTIAKAYARGHADPQAVLLRTLAAVKSLIALLSATAEPPRPAKPATKESAFGFAACFRHYILESPEGQYSLLAWIVGRGLGRMVSDRTPEGAIAFLEEYGFFASLQELFGQLGLAPEKALRAMRKVKLLLLRGREFSNLLAASGTPPAPFFESLLSSEEASILFPLRQEGDAETMDPATLHALLALLATVHVLDTPVSQHRRHPPALEHWTAQAQAAGYRRDEFLRCLNTPPPPIKPRSRRGGRGRGPSRHR